jgi:hypothetical protein
VERIRLATKRTKVGKSGTKFTLVDLKKVMLPEPGVKKLQQQSADEMRGTLAVLSAQYGIPLRRSRG